MRWPGFLSGKVTDGWLTLCPLSLGDWKGIFAVKESWKEGKKGASRHFQQHIIAVSYACPTLINGMKRVKASQSKSKPSLDSPRTLSITMGETHPLTKHLSPFSLSFPFLSSPFSFGFSFSSTSRRLYLSTFPQKKKKTPSPLPPFLFFGLICSNIEYVDHSSLPLSKGLFAAAFFGIPLRHFTRVNHNTTPLTFI